jgi:threonine synthase
LADYELSRGTPGLRQVRTRAPGLLRLPELAPLRSHHFASLGEGATPLVPAEGLAVELDLPHLMIKDEAQNPAGSWESRGIAMATAHARELGLGRIKVRSAGDSARAAAGYASLQGLDLQVELPEATDEALVHELKESGAIVKFVSWAEYQNTSFSGQDHDDGAYLDLSAMAEPYRLEGAKTLGFELIYDLGRVPDAVLVPTGAGIGLVAVAKAFDEMEAMGWIGPVRPKLIAVQSAQFAPLVHAFRKHRDSIEPWTRGSQTSVRELRCSSQAAGTLALAALRHSRGTAVAIEEEQIHEGRSLLRRHLGLGGSLATGACVSAARRLRQSGFLQREDLIILVSPSNRA